MLEVEDLHAYYGASHVVQGISFSIERGEAVALMGRNGVGKTSTLKSIMGLETRTTGTIRFDGAIGHRAGVAHPGRRAAWATCPRSAPSFRR